MRPILTLGFSIRKISRAMPTEDLRSEAHTRPPDPAVANTDEEGWTMVQHSRLRLERRPTRRQWRKKRQYAQTTATAAHPNTARSNSSQGATRSRDHQTPTSAQEVQDTLTEAAPQVQQQQQRQTQAPSISLPEVADPELRLPTMRKMYQRSSSSIMNLPRRRIAGSSRANHGKWIHRA